MPDADVIDGAPPAALAQLPRSAAVWQALDCPRATAFVPSGSNEASFEEQFERAVARLRPLAATLAAHGCVLGFEFCGPKTFRDAFRYPFLFTMDGVRALGRAIGTGNVGVLLDV